ncbi:MAG TPA: sugar transferase, partial [Candidatus Eisenbacteria bacterium]
MNPTLTLQTQYGPDPAIQGAPAPGGRRKHERLVLLRTSMVLLDLLAIAGSMAVAMTLGKAGIRIGPGLLPVALLSAAIWIGSVAWAGGYEVRLLGRRLELTTRLLKASILAVILQILVDFSLRPAFPMPGRGALMIFWLSATALVLTLRWSVWRWVVVRALRGRLISSAVVVGADPESQRRSALILRWMLFPPVVRRVIDGEGVTEEIERLAASGSIDQVLVVREDIPRDTLIELVQRCVGWGLTVVVASPAFNVMIGRAPVFVLDGLPVIEIQPSGLFTPARQIKRGLDLVGALIGGTLLLPLFALIALAIKLTSRGPVFYRQERVGRDGRVFHFFKFRSMVVNNDEHVHRAYLENLVRNGAEATLDRAGQKVYKLVDDPRVTPIGAFLRRTSLDELPQLWNIIKGEMSLVGP